MNKKQLETSQEELEYQNNQNKNLEKRYNALKVNCEEYENKIIYLNNKIEVESRNSQ